MRNIHEYEADRAVLRAGFDPKQYQRMLIKKAAGAGRYSIADSLNHSKIKNRITMMLQKESGPRARLKVLVMLPLAAIGLMAFASREYLSPQGKDRVKIAKIITSHARWSAPKGAEMAKTINIMQPETMPIYLSVDMEIIHKPYKNAERPSGIVTMNGQDNIEAYFYIQPAANIDRSISDRRFFINVKDQLPNGSITFGDVSELAERFSPELYALIPDEIKRVPLSVTIRKDGNSLSFGSDIEGKPTEKPYTYGVNGTDVQYISMNVAAATIDIDAEGNIFFEGERVETENLYDYLTAKAHLSHSGTLNPYEVRVFINADDRTKFGTVKEIRKKLSNSGPVFSWLANEDLPITTPNSYLECSDSLFQYSVSGFLPEHDYQRRPYYETLTKNYYQTDDPEELRRNLIEVVIKGDQIYANGELTDIANLSAKIREIAGKQNRDITK